MICQEIAIGLMLNGHGYSLVLYTAKMLVVVFLRFVFTKGGGETNGIVVGRDGNQPLVESLVIQCRKADAIARIEPVFFVRLLCPGDDVAGQYPSGHNGHHNWLESCDESSPAPSFVLFLR